MSADVAHLTCRQLVEILTAYLDGALDPAERADVERHIVICRGCANHVEQMHSTIDLLGRLAPAGEDEASPAVLLERFRDWSAQR